MKSIKEALKIAIDHIEHMAAHITKANEDYHVGQYSFESLGEDMPNIKAALAQLDSADARGIAGAARKCADDLANIVEASVRVAHRTGNSFALDRNKTASMIAGYFTGLLPDASPGKPAAIVTCCITGAIPGDGGACGDCDPCLMGEASMPEPVKRLIAEKNSLLQRIGELEDAVAASPDNGAEKALEKIMDRSSDFGSEPRKLSVVDLTNKISELHDIAVAALHSTSAAGETCNDCGYREACDEKCPNCNDANEYGDYEGPTCEVCGGTGKIAAGETTSCDGGAVRELLERISEYTHETHTRSLAKDALAALAAIDKLSPEVKAEGGRDEPVAIKPLEWRDHRPDSFPEPAWSAQTPFGYYNIEEVSASDSPAYVVRLHNHHFIADKDSLEDAKAGAQADYERRIRSALVVHPVSPPDVEAIRADEREKCAAEVERRNWPTVGDARRIASAIRTGGQKP